MCIWLIIIRGTLPRYRLDSLALKVWKEWILLWIVLFVINILLIIFFI